jgi:hypothetical protein
MGREIDEKKIQDATKPWRKKFFEVREIGKEPPISTGFWKKPVHGIKIKGGE